MAEEESLQQQAEAKQDAGPEAEAGSKLKLLIFLVITLLLTAIVGTAIYYILAPGKEKEMGIGGSENEAFNLEYEKRRLTSVDTLKGNREPILSAVYDYTVNMKDGKHLMRLKWMAKMYDPAAKIYLGQRTPAINDKVISLLKNSTVEELRNRSGVELLKRKIHTEINGFFSEEFIALSESKDRSPVKDILIMEYYVN
ncbi:MAG: hypothetical protein GY866_00335 [Proteobacteria bacterium]|nr:hypothetical protein [Pseudomonadota bacterium]